MDRPSRKTKVVNYCDSKDFDDDDEDFAFVKAPPSKKAREEHKKSSSKSSTQETDLQSSVSCMSRKPLDEKLYDRDLEAALTLSLLRAADGKEEDQSPSKKEDVKDHLPVDENTDPSSPRLSNCSVNSTLLGLDEITTEQELPCAPSRQRKAAKATEQQRSKLKDEDEDYHPKLTPDSESDNDFSEQGDSEDEEFTLKKVNKTIKKEKRSKNEKTRQPPVSKKEKQPPKPSNAKSSANSKPVRSPPPAKLKSEPRRPATSTTASTSKPAVSLSPAGGRTPKWNPPGQIGRSPSSSQNATVKSPGQGLRLGLSRLVRVKPLHPSVASH